MTKMWKAAIFLLAVAYTSLAWLAFNFKLGAYDKVLTPEDKWTAFKLSRMALGPEMAGIVSRASRIYQADASDIRGAILSQVSDGKGRKKNGLAELGRNYDPAKSCATEDTAGWGGIAQCTSLCENAYSFSRQAPHEGACRLLCTVAVQPCTSSILAELLALPAKRIKGNLSWASWAKNWSRAWVETLVKAMTATASFFKDIMAGGGRLVIMHIRNGDWVSLLVLLLPVLLAVHTTMDVFNLSALESRGRRAGKNVKYLRRQACLMTFNRVYRSRPKKCTRQGLYCRRGVSRWLFRGVVKAKDEAVRRRVAAGLLSGAEEATEKSA